MAPSPNRVFNETPDPTSNHAETDDLDFEHSTRDGLSARPKSAPPGLISTPSIPTSGDLVPNIISSESQPGKTEELSLKEMEYCNVRLEVQNLIAPWRESRKKPPFTAAELLVIACLLSECVLTKTEILSDLLHLFRYYRTKAIDQYAFGQVTTGEDDDAPHLDAAIDGFKEAFDVWDAPLVDFEGEELVRWKIDGSDEVNIDVPPRAGRIFLRRLLEPERKGSFRFIDLPAEIRNQIYEIMFSMPGRVVEVDKFTGESRCRLFVQRRFEDNKQEPPEDSCDRLELNPGNVLALLLANKQVYVEAMPFFYGLNCFSCLSLGDLQAMLACVPTPRLKQIRHLTLSIGGYDYDQYVAFESTMKKLCAIRKLHSLKLVVVGYPWLRMPKYAREAFGRKSRFSSFGPIPGFRDLAVVGSRAEQLTIEQWSDTDTDFEKWMKTEVAKIKERGEEVVEPRRTRRKRKTVADGAGDEENAEGKKVKQG